MKKQTKAKRKGKNIALTVGIGAALVAAAAGAYFLYGKDGAKNRKKVKSWALKAKGEALEKIEKMKHVSQDTYHDVIETVGAKYGKLKEVTPEEAALFVKEMKGHWKHIKAEVAPKPKAAAKKAGKKK